MKGESTFIHVRNKTMISLIVIAAVVLFILIMFFSFVPIGLWISAMAAGVHVGIFSLVGMRLRRVDRKSTRLNSSHTDSSRMPSSA